MPEGAAAVADGVLLGVRHLRRGARVAFRLEAGIVAVAAAAARRPDDAAVERAVHQLDMLVGPGQRQHAMEGGGARRVGVRHLARRKLVLDAAHADHGVPRRAFPVGGVEAGLAVERLYAQAGIVGQRRQAAGTGGGQRLQRRVVLEGLAGLLGRAAGRARPPRRSRRRRARAACGSRPPCRGCGWPRPAWGRRSGAALRMLADRQPLQARQLADAFLGKHRAAP